MDLTIEIAEEAAAVVIRAVRQSAATAQAGALEYDSWKFDLVEYDSWARAFSPTGQGSQ